MVAAARITILGPLLAEGAAIVRESCADGERNTARHYAAGRGHGEALAAMTAAARAQPDAPALLPRLLNAANSRGQTALALACEAGHERCTAELIGAGADVFLWPTRRAARRCTWPPSAATAPASSCCSRAPRSVTRWLRPTRRP